MKTIFRCSSRPLATRIRMCETAAVVGAVGSYGVKQGVPALIERLNDDDDHIRMNDGRIALG